MFRKTTFLLFAVFTLLTLSAFANINSFVDLEGYTKKYQLKLQENSLNKKDVDTLKADLEFIDGKNLILKGFLYKNKAGAWLLSPEPSLKTCCVGGKKKVMSQLYLDKEFDDDLINQVVTLEGVFHINQEEDSEGGLTKLFSLEHVRVHNSESKSFLPYLVVAVGMLLVLWFLSAKKKIAEGS
ncbi:MAG: hypothetical protein GWP59_04160 [Chlamydiales bacterium]|nr:hypothetical protein [Chlamydiales bacterium]NCF70878.1 hypothetical protein [Chlamydiales bacterium]